MSNNIMNMIYKMLATKPILNDLFMPPAGQKSHYHYNWSGRSKTFKKNKRKGL